MAPPVEKPRSKPVHFRIYDDLSLLNPVNGEAGKVPILGKKTQIQTKDSTTEISRDPNGLSVVFTYPLDIDDDPDNGRLYLKDRFLLNPSDKTLTEVRRSFYGGRNGAPPAGPWNALYARLKKLEERPLNHDDPAVQGFFRDVVLKIPELEGAGMEVESSLFGPRLTLHRPMTPIALPSTPSNIEEAYFHRLFTLLSIEGLKDPILAELEMSLYRPSPWEERPALPLDPEDNEEIPSLQKRMENEKNPQNKIFLEGLIALSDRNFRKARLLFTSLYDQIPSSQIVLRWIGDYEQAQKNLNVAGLMRSIADEEMTKSLKASKAWIRNISPSSSWSHKNTETKAKSIKGLFDEIERRIVTGSADSVDQAILQIEGAGLAEEKEAITLIQSSSFAEGLISDLRRASSAREGIQEMALMMVLQEKRRLLSPCLAEKLYDFLSHSGDPAVFNPARYQRERLRMGEVDPKPLNEILLDQFTDPLMVVSLLAGNTAFNLASARIQASMAEKSVKSLLLANLGGTFSEALAFESSRRLAGHAFVGEMDYGGTFLTAVAKNHLTFGSLRFTRAGLNFKSGPLEKAAFPFIALYITDRMGATLPFPETERGQCGFQQKEDPGARFLKTAVFYGQHQASDWLMARLLLGRISRK